jgi:transposase
VADGPVTAVARRQVVDLPPLRLVVTEHQALTLACPHCQQPTTAAFPPTVDQPVRYGPRLLGLGLYLRHYQLLPYQRIVELFTDLFGRGPTAGTLHTASLAGAAALAPVEMALKTALGQAAVAHADETSCVVAGRRQWIHVVCTPTLTHYGRHEKRGQAATEAIGILPGFGGRLIHDAWAPYWHYGCQHGLCNAHLLRELTAVAEQPDQAWATGLLELLRELQRHVAQGRAAGQTASAPVERDQFVVRYRALLADGYAANPPPVRAADGPRRGRLKQSPARNLLDRLTAREAEVLAFLHDWTVPFDNNQAERDLRMIKVQQKISGTFRDPAGADAFCRLRGYISTLRKQGRYVLTALTETLAGQPPRPALLPE